MSDVTRDEDGFHNGVGRRATGARGRLESGGGREGDGHLQVPVLAGGVERLASGAVPRDRIAELEDAAGYSGSGLRRERKLFLWHGARARLTSSAVEDRRAVIIHLTAICKAERQRGLNGHWTYDLARHNQLAELLSREEAELQDILTGGADATR